MKARCGMFTLMLGLGIAQAADFPLPSDAAAVVGRQLALPDKPAGKSSDKRAAKSGQRTGKKPPAKASATAVKPPAGLLKVPLATPSAKQGAAARDSKGKKPGGALSGKPLLPSLGRQLPAPGGKGQMRKTPAPPALGGLPLPDLKNRIGRGGLARPNPMPGGAGLPVPGGRGRPCASGGVGIPGGPAMPPSPGCAPQDMGRAEPRGGAPGGRGGGLPDPSLHPRLEAVEHRSGRQGYLFRGIYLSYSPDSLGRCLALDPRGDTLVALKGRNLRGFGFGEQRQVRLSRIDGRRHWALPVESASDGELVVRVPRAVYREIYPAAARQTNPPPHRFELVENGRVQASQPVELCNGDFRLVVRARFENCVDSVGSLYTWDSGIRVQGYEHADFVTRHRERDWTGFTVEYELRVSEGDTGRLVLRPPENGVCGGGRWTQEEVTVEPLVHGRNRAVVEVTHRSEPVEQRIGEAALNQLVGRLLNLRIRLHNFAGNRVFVDRDASWVKVGLPPYESEYRFTIPRFRKELGGVIDEVVPDLISFVNDLNSDRFELRFEPAGDRLAIEAKLGFESKGVEIRNYANTGSDDVGDHLYADAHIDHLQVTVRGLYLGWDASRGVPAVLGRPEVRVSLDFDLRGAGEILEALNDFETDLERQIAQQVEQVLSRGDVRRTIDEGVLRLLDGLRGGRPPVKRFLEARAEGGDFVVRYIPDRG